MELKTALALLHENLRMYYPDLLASLNPALLNDEITALEKQFHRPLPPEIRQLYRWKNGNKEATDHGFVNGFRWLPLAEMLAHRSSDQSERYGFKNNQYPLFANTLGRVASFLCYDTDGLYNGQKGALFCLYGDEPFNEDIATSLTDFVQKMNASFGHLPVQKSSEGFLSVPFNGKIRGK